MENDFSNNSANLGAKFFVKSLGCKTNHIEGQIISQELLKAGFIEAKTPSDCDFYILNTCSVTSHADNQALYLIKQFKTNNPKSKIILTGCFAQTAEDKSLIGADLILGNDEKLDIVSHIKALSDIYPGKPAQNDEKIIKVGDIFSVNAFKHKNLEIFSTTRPSIKIQEGCSNRCSYCIIPYARGNSRSDTEENIINQVNSLALSGYKEVVIVGIHIGEWGKEFNKTLFDLVKSLENTDIQRYRLGSLYVTEIGDEMIEFLQSSEKFCPHFHLSLQSLCDKTLKNMNRFYTKEYAKNVIQKLHSAFELPFIGCDIITGFPGEDENDFKETYEALEEAKLSFIHSFPYSKRKGTPAYNMPNQTYEHVKKERTKRLISLSDNLHKEFLQKNKSKAHEVLFQKKDKKTGKYLGITRNYIKVYKESGKNLWNTIETLNLEGFELG